MTADDQLLLLFEGIAQERLSIPTLERRGRDFLDFHDISAWGLLTVLQDAYDAGLKAGRRQP